MLGKNWFHFSDHTMYSIIIRVKMNTGSASRCSPPIPIYIIANWRRSIGRIGNIYCRSDITEFIANRNRCQYTSWERESDLYEL